jgi:hypothetical protein
MNNKTELLVETLLSEVKQKPEIFGSVTYSQTNGTNFASADVELTKDNHTDTYRVMVIKQSS